MSNISDGNSNTSIADSSSDMATSRDHSQTSVCESEVFDRPKLSSESNDEEIMKEVCLNNGINYARLPLEGSGVKVLEMFFSGFPRLIGLHHFPNICTLTIIGQSISALTGLSALTMLKTLWVAECQIQKIEGLEKCSKLEKLYLYGNQITRMENLHFLHDLLILWLNSNNIRNIENMTNLANLNELNVAENKIEKIGHTLDFNVNLEELNLSGNPISSLKDLTNLMRLPNLKSISLKDPLYAPCPVSQLCNYSTYILFHLPALHRLDTYDVTTKHLADLAANTVLKKKMYYNMRLKTLERDVSHMLESQEKHKRSQLLKLPHQRLHSVIYAIKEIERKMDEKKEKDDIKAYISDCESSRVTQEHIKATGDSSSSQNFAVKLEALRNRKIFWERTCEELESFTEKAKDQIQCTADRMTKRLMVELETGGNVHFEEGTSSDVWFSSCHDLMMSRFCETDFKAYGVLGIKIHHIVRIHNRVLRAQFDKKIIQFTEEILGEYYPSRKHINCKKMLEYLFWIWDPDKSGGALQPVLIAEEGFMDAETCKLLGQHAAVPLTNSLYLADRHRLSSLAKHEDVNGCLSRFGQLIVAKAFLGRSACASDKREIESSLYPKIDAVFKPRLKCIPENSVASECECSARQCEWYIFDHEMVLPEYIIEYEYVTKVHPSAHDIGLTLTKTLDGLSDRKFVEFPHQTTDWEVIRSDDIILSMEPHIQQRPRMVTLTEELLLKSAMSENLSAITYLNLHGNGLTRLKYIQKLSSLKTLIVTFNELTRIDDLSHMNIKQLDASFNKISTLDGFKSMPCLEQLDLSWNSLHNTREELSILRKHCTVLRHLDIRHNPWLKPDNLKLRVLGRIKTLSWLDGDNVCEQESQMSLQVVARSRISKLSLLTNSRIDTELPRSLILGCGAQVISHYSLLKPDRVSETDTSWYLQITTLNLESQHLTKLSNLDHLEKLRWASFNDNYLTKIEGLEKCTRLEDLSLDNNCISHLDGLSKLTQLTRLSIAHNQLSSADTGALTHLPHLAYLALDNNHLTSLSGLQQLHSLMELYIGNNLIACLREIFLLKHLPSLVLLDLCGNPMTTETENYRLFVIYHLKFLSGLDGKAVEAQEMNVAKYMFGGRLTQDFIAGKLGLATFQDIYELDLPNCNIHIVELGPDSPFVNLRSLNLDGNNLTSFAGLSSLTNLRVLCLNNNHIESVVPCSKEKQSSSVYPNKTGLECFSELFQPILEHLEVLHLGYNGIRDMAALQLRLLPSLKALFLQGNEITKVEGLEELHNLQELVLDHNKIRIIPECAFTNLLNLQELHLEENRLRDLASLSCLEKLQRLYLGSNRIQDVTELEKLDSLRNLTELSVLNNAVARRLVHRIVLIFLLPQLMFIDGIPVTDEERSKAEVYFADQVQQNNLTEAVLPDIIQGQQHKIPIPVKVTNMQLGSPFTWARAGTNCEDAESIQKAAKCPAEVAMLGRLTDTDRLSKMSDPSSRETTRKGKAS